MSLVFDCNLKTMSINLYLFSHNLREIINCSLDILYIEAKLIVFKI